MAQYKLVRTPNPNNDGQEMPYHARYVASGTVSLSKLSKEISQRSTFSPGEVKGVVQMIQDMLTDYLMLGYNVKVDGIGMFSVSLQCPPVMNKKEIRAESISFRSVNFRPSAELCRRLKTIPLFREPEEKGKYSFSQEERKERMLNYLDKNRRLTGSIYMWLNHCSRACGSRDLRLFRQEGLIQRHGRGPTVYYTKIT